MAKERRDCLPDDGAVLSVGDLLDKKGALIQGGYAFSQVKRYDRSAIRGDRSRIKEWDYYCFGDDKYAVALTVANNSYMSLASVSVLDFDHLTYLTRSRMGGACGKKLKMPSSCEDGDVAYKKSGVTMNFYNSAGERRLVCEFKKFDGTRDFSCDIELDKPTGDNITTAVPFSKRKQFYYNTKVNCLAVKGRFSIGDDIHEFASGASGVLDWGRGVWPYRNVWYWSSLSCRIDGREFGLNLGYGFGKPKASENVVFYDGKAHKLDNVKFEIPYTRGKPDYLKKWRIADDAGRLELAFFPMIDRKDRTNAIVLMTDQHQVFGKFFGKVTLDDGTIVDVTDKIGFAEYVRNKW